MHRNVARGFTLIELMIVVSILGILAVVAIPAFVRYMRVAKTAEAYRNVALIAKGINQYYVRPHFDDNGSRLPCQFPHEAPVQWAPAQGSCCTDGEPDGKCEPNEAVWNRPVWRAILFKISDKHYYSYRAMRPLPAVIYSEASADLDCDGTYSIFRAIYFGYTSTGFASTGIHNCYVERRGMLVLDETE